MFGEGEGDDRVLGRAVGLAVVTVANDPGDPAGDGLGLAAARARNNQQIAADVVDGLLLRVWA